MQARVTKNTAWKRGEKGIYEEWTNYNYLKYDFVSFAVIGALNGTSENEQQQREKRRNPVNGLMKIGRKLLLKFSQVVSH